MCYLLEWVHCVGTALICFVKEHNAMTVVKLRSCGNGTAKMRFEKLIWWNQFGHKFTYQNQANIFSEHPEPSVAFSNAKYVSAHVHCYVAELECLLPRMQQIFCPSKTWRTHADVQMRVLIKITISLVLYTIGIYGVFFYAVEWFWYSALDVCRAHISLFHFAKCGKMHERFPCYF